MGILIIPSSQKEYLSTLLERQNKYTQITKSAAQYLFPVLSSNFICIVLFSFVVPRSGAWRHAESFPIITADCILICCFHPLQLNLKSISPSHTPSTFDLLPSTGARHAFMTDSSSSLHTARLLIHMEMSVDSPYNDYSTNSREMNEYQGRKEKEEQTDNNGQAKTIHAKWKLTRERRVRKHDE